MPPIYVQFTKSIPTNIKYFTNLVQTLTQYCLCAKNMHVYPTIKGMSGSVEEVAGIQAEVYRSSPSAFQAMLHAPTPGCSAPVVKRCTACGAKGWMATLQPAECARALRSCGQPRDPRSQMLAAAGGRTHRTAVPHGQELGAGWYKRAVLSLPTPCVSGNSSINHWLFTSPHTECFKKCSLHNPSSLKTQFPSWSPP